MWRSTEDDDDPPLLLVRARPGGGSPEPFDEVDTRTGRVRLMERHDRLRPATSGAFAGAVAGGAAAAIVQLIDLEAIARIVRYAETRWQLEGPIASAAPYVAAAVVGAVIGAGFGKVTRHLRRFVPLLAWGLVFFPCLAMLIEAAARAYVPDASISAQATLAASLAFGIILPLQLPLRRGVY